MRKECAQKEIAIIEINYWENTLKTSNTVSKISTTRIKHTNTFTCALKGST